MTRGAYRGLDPAVAAAPGLGKAETEEDAPRAMEPSLAPRARQEHIASPERERNQRGDRDHGQAQSRKGPQQGAEDRDQRREEHNSDGTVALRNDATQLFLLEWLLPFTHGT